MIPSWMNESFAEALRANIYDSELGDPERGSFLHRVSLF